MDGRWKRLLATGILFGTVGCGGSLRDKRPAPPINTAEPPLSAVSRKPKEEDFGRDKTPIKVETLVALGNVRLQSAAMPERTAAERDDLCGEARKTFQAALLREPRNVDAMLGMARTYKLAQDKNKSVEWYQQAAKTAPKNAGIWGEMGQSLDALKDRDAAIQCYHTATKMEPENKNYCKALGFALARSGRYDEAIAWLNRCMSPADAQFNLARMMDHNGHHDQANQHFAQALKIDPSFEQARMALNNTSGPSDRMFDPNQIQAVSYEQVTLIPNTPVTVTSSIRDNNIPVPPAALRPPATLPLNVTQPSSTNAHGWGRIK